MVFVNQSSYITDNVADDSAAFVLLLESDALAAAVDANADDEAGFELILNADANPRGYFPYGFDGDLSLAADALPDVLLVLKHPETLAETLAANSFTNAIVGRLSANNVVMPFWKRATLTAPKDSLGASFSVDLAKADLSFLPSDANWKFEVGVWNASTEIYDYHTVFDSAKLSSRNLSRGWSGGPQDSLSFSTLIDINDKFALAPRKNIICYDVNKTSVDISKVEKLYDSGGDLIVNNVRSFNGLSLNRALNIAFVEGCGFSSVETDLDNYPLTRVDFNISTTYKDSVAPFIGNYKPIFTVLPGNVLQIKDGTRGLPVDFEPAEIKADYYSGIGLQKKPRPASDGFVVQYQSSGDYATYLIRVAPSVITETGNIFDANYTKQTITETYVDFYDLYYPEQITKTNLIKRETVITDSIGFAISEQTEEITVDKTGKTLKSVKTEKATLMPDNSFKTLRSETQNYEYQNDITNSRSVILKSIKTTIKAIVATDSDNQYFGSDFRQEYSEAHRAGNLSEDLSYSAFPEPVKTITKIFDQIGNGQIRVTETLIDILRDNFPVVTVSETTNGDISINDAFSKARQMVVFRDGASKTGNGKPLGSISLGEIPAFFGYPLTQRLLENEDLQLDEGSATIAAYSPDLQRGLIVSAIDRDGTNLGKFLVAGFSWTIEKVERGQRVETSLEISQLV